MRQAEFNFLSGEIEFSGKQLRDAGITLATDHANGVHENWSDTAFEMFKEWLSGWPQGYKFLIEDARKSMEIKGLPSPPHLRAYGWVAVRAKRAGLIKSSGTTQVKNPLAHRANANVWMKV